jgi:DNA invertase Pin-like site-specific DNA recombinase
MIYKCGGCELPYESKEFGPRASYCPRCNPNATWNVPITSAVAYMRCSGRGQVDGDTWDRQEEAISKYAAANGITVVSWFRDEAVTGKMELEGRDGLSACVHYVQTEDVKLVLVEDSTRLARDLIVAEVCIREFQRVGVRVVSASGGIDLTEGDSANPTAKLVRQILAAVSEFERCCIYNKLMSARKRKKAAGGKAEGRYAFGEDPKRPEEIATLEKIKFARSNTMTCDQIADSMNVAQVPTRSGKPWRGTTVAKILKRSA